MTTEGERIKELEAALAACEQRVADYKEVQEDKCRLCRKIDVILFGEDGAAKQASLCDLIGPIEDLKAEPGGAGTGEANPDQRRQSDRRHDLDATRHDAKHDPLGVY